MVIKALLHDRIYIVCPIPDSRGVFVCLYKSSETIIISPFQSTAGRPLHLYVVRFFLLIHCEGRSCQPLLQRPFR